MKYAMLCCCAKAHVTQGANEERYQMLARIFSGKFNNPATSVSREQTGSLLQKDKQLLGRGSGL